MMRLLGGSLQTVLFDLLIEIAARHLELACGLAHVPRILGKFRFEEGSFGGLSKLLERLPVRETADRHVGAGA